MSVALRHLLTSVGLPMLAVILLGLADTAKAEGGSDKIDQAASAFSALDFEGALKILEQAHATPGNGRQELVRIFAIGGLCLVSLGRIPEAERAFEALLSIDPAYRLGDEVSPRYREPFTKVLESGVARMAVEVNLPERISVGEPVPVEIKLLADPAGVSSKLVFRYRRKGHGKFSSMGIKLGTARSASFYLPPKIWHVSDRGAELQPIEWYAQLQDRFGGQLLHKGSSDHPVAVAVVEALPKVIPALSGLTADGHPTHVDEPAWYKHWWVWAIVGGVAVAAAGTTAAAMTLGGQAPQERNFNLEIQ